MRSIYPIFHLMFLFSSVGFANNFSIPKCVQCSEAMGKLAFMKGMWEGPAAGINHDGSKYSTHQTERAGTMLGGDVMVIEGRGYKEDGTVSFNALGVISWDSQKNKYEFRSYAQGFSGTFDFELTSDGYIWEVPAGPTLMRYKAVVKEGNWKEIGERIVPGQPPVQIFEMNLKRIGDTDWPAGNPVPPTLEK